MKIETRSIEWVPHNERHGHPKSLFSVWFGANMHITTLVSGALCVTIGLNLFWSIVAVILGALIGAIFTASHSAQGPTLGVPQMIQSRAQFGVIGAVIPLAVVVFMYLGFLASSGLLGAQTIVATFDIHLTPAIVVMSICTFIIALFGHDLIHKMQKFFTIFFLATYIILTFLVFQVDIPAGAFNANNFNLANFILGVAIVATWQISYAPYVADYSRYLPEDTSAPATFWYSYIGLVLASIWMMLLGVFLTTAIPGFLDNTGPNLAKLYGPFAIIMLFSIIFGQFSINVFNLYGAFMSTVTTIEPFAKMKVTPKVRGGFMFVLMAIATGIQIWGQGQFLELFGNFISFICYLLIPWTAINLVDYYMVRHGKYSVKDFFDINGIYGKVNWSAALAYIAAILFQIPFMNLSFYVGPAAQALGGADLAWILGLVVPAVIYYYPMKKVARRELERGSNLNL
ncbi:purine-cytosine permease family protein [Clostridium cylindrosporum]|uniref:Purine-cytosine permease n=1 Tax=Clostridium cylindrosporum DSM 605 TaxID=1121307 RepID=A0A0J8G3C3_CLOCY|nr:cytosine permease [Clostridium cylindrosporum]KMT22206.1 purine-cytosine permease [Clostridium cylindrosporum DSM 605]